MVIVTVAPTARLPTVQVTVPDACVQVPWVDDADTKVTPAGRVSVTPTPVAGLGPLFLATAAHVNAMPTVTLYGAFFVIKKSAWIGAVTQVGAEAVVLPRFGVGFSPPTC